MTLRGWAFLFIAGILMFIHSGANAQTNMPSVWEQLQRSRGPEQKVRGTVTAIKAGSGTLTVEITPADHKQSKLSQIPLCVEPALRAGDAGAIVKPSDLAQASLFHQRLELLKEAQRRGKIVDLSLVGTTSKCLDTIRVAD